jgi:uncharacterized membrane protein (DUF106 family)
LSFIDDFINFLAGPIQNACPHDPLKPAGCTPLSAFIVLGAALFLSLIAMLANRFLVNYKMVASYRREYMNWMNAVRKARKDGDEKQLEKLMKRQSAVMKMSSRATLEQLKTYPITIVPFYLIYAVLGHALASTQYTAYAPFVFPFATIITNTAGVDVAAGLPLFFWYLVCSFTISIPLSRIFGVSAAFSMSPTTGDTK